MNDPSRYMVRIGGIQHNNSRNLKIKKKKKQNQPSNYSNAHAPSAIMGIHPAYSVRLPGCRKLAAAADVEVMFVLTTLVV